LFNFDLEYLGRVQSSEPLHTKMNLTSCWLGSRFVSNPFFLLAGAFLFDEKIRLSSALFWFGLRNDGILYLQAATPRKIVDSSAFLEQCSAEKIAVCDHTTRDPNNEDD
jgi:hypothetical protein